MKNIKLIIKISVFNCLFCICSSQLKAQIIQGTNGPNIWGQTDNSQKIEAIGIGDYTNANAQPNAALDITIPYLFVNSPPFIYL